MPIMICNHDTPGSSKCTGDTVWAQSPTLCYLVPYSFWCGTFLFHIFSLLLSCPSNLSKQVHLQQQLAPVTEEILLEENQYHREATTEATQVLLEVIQSNAYCGYLYYF